MSLIIFKNVPLIGKYLTLFRPVRSVIGSNAVGQCRSIALGKCVDKESDKLTQEEKAAYSKLFNDIDKDSDGIISKMELKQGLNDFIGYSATDNELDESLIVLDRNKDGKVDLNDFLVHMLIRKQTTRKEAIRFTFEMWDSNGDGYIEREDLKCLLRAAGEQPTETKVDNILKVTDLNNDGRLSFEEFKDIFKYKDFKLT